MSSFCKASNFTSIASVEELSDSFTASAIFFCKVAIKGSGLVQVLFMAFSTTSISVSSFTVLATQGSIALVGSRRLRQRQTMDLQPLLFQWIRLNISPQLPQYTMLAKTWLELKFLFLPLELV